MAACLPSVPSDFASYSDVPITVIGFKARIILSKHLNMRAEIVSDSHHLPDFTGVAEILGYDYPEICGFERSPDPLGKILETWSSGSRSDPTITRLCSIIRQLGREDILEEAWNVIVRDIETWRRRQAELRSYVPVQDETVSSVQETDHHVDQFLYMTNDDVRRSKPTYYDAFICFSTQDIDFIKEMIKQLEGVYGLKLCVPDRDMLAGGSFNTISARLIEERCKKIVAVISPHFLSSPECDFQIKFAQAVSPGSRSKKLIPILKQSCLVPNILRHITLCDFTKADLQEWFWQRLASAIKMPAPTSRDDSESLRLSQIKVPENMTSGNTWFSSSSDTTSSSSNNSSIHSSRC